MEDILNYLAEEAAAIIAAADNPAQLQARVTASQNHDGGKFYSVIITEPFTGRGHASGASNSPEKALATVAEHLQVYYPIPREYRTEGQRNQLLGLAAHPFISQPERISVMLGINRFTPATATATIQALEDAIVAHQTILDNAPAMITTMVLNKIAYTVTGEAYQVAQDSPFLLAYQQEEAAFRKIERMEDEKCDALCWGIDNGLLPAGTTELPNEQTQREMLKNFYGPAYTVTGEAYQVAQELAGPTW